MSFTQSTFTSQQQQPQYVPQQSAPQQQQQHQPYAPLQQQRPLAPHPPRFSTQQGPQLPRPPLDQVSHQQPPAQLQSQEPEQEGESTLQNRNGSTSMDTMMEHSQEQSVRKKRDVCQGFAPRSNNYHANTITLLEGMMGHPPFVGHGQKKEAWEKVAAYVRTQGGRDLKKANYLLCMRRYDALKKEFKQQEAASRRSSGGTETMTRQDELLLELVQKEDDFDGHRQQQSQSTVDDFSAQNLEEFYGHTNRQESLRQMSMPTTSSATAASSSSMDPSSSTSSSFSSSSSSSTTTATSSNPNRLATAESVRFNPINRRAPRSQAPRASTVEKRMLELMENINGLVSDIRKKI